MIGRNRYIHALTKSKRLENQKLVIDNQTKKRTIELQQTPNSDNKITDKKVMKLYINNDD